jgi:hypothetical protein
VSEQTPLTERELKLTAAVYATRSWVVEQVRTTGKLPESIPTGGVHIGMRLLIERRGADLALTSDEQLIYDAIVREARLPGGAVRLVSEQETGGEPRGRGHRR